jgi:1A family penicillin-binding protein
VSICCGSIKNGLILAILLTGLSISGCTAKGGLFLPDVSVPSVIFDARGEPIGTVSRENRLPVSLDEISKFMQDAIVAAEDARFYSHHGIDPLGIARAVVRNIQAGEIVEGGSTITQQLVKNLYLDQQRTFWRKSKELVLTVQIERKYTKKEILEMYLNQIYFGQGAYGIETAARTYFNKPAKELNLAESAMLAGIPRAPSLYSPSQNWEAAKKRQTTVLNRMTELGMIDSEKARRAKEEFLQPAKAQANIQRAPFFVAEIVNHFEKSNPAGLETLYSGGLSIYTTLDLKMQEAAEKALTEGLSGLDPRLEGALVAIDPRSGHIKAMVGGRDFTRSQYNRALAKIQAGSTFKPIVYTAAIDSGFTAGSTITCEPVTFTIPGAAPYQPKDFEGGTHNRPFTLKEALYTSDNVVAVRLNDLLGPAKVASYARRMGVESPVNPVLSLPLGTSEVTPLEMARAFGVLANRGIKADTVSIQKIVDGRGRILEDNKPKMEQVLDEKTAAIVTDMLTAVLKPGGTAAGVSAIISRPAAGKTGTTENYKDAWFIGYTPDLVTAVYIGYDDKGFSAGSTGGQLAAPIWARFTAEALKDSPPLDFVLPPGVVKVNICPEDGLLAGPFNKSGIEAVFVRGTEPAVYCPDAGIGITPPPGPPGLRDAGRRFFQELPDTPFWQRFLPQSEKGGGKPVNQGGLFVWPTKSSVSFWGEDFQFVPGDHRNTGQALSLYTRRADPS